mgnify:CR=1 FL=1
MNFNEFRSKPQFYCINLACDKFSQVDMIFNYMLSCLVYWIEEYKVDGFRFDAVTAMLYRDFGANKNAIELATNPDKLKAIKDKLQSNLSITPLFDTEQYLLLALIV